MVTKPDVRKLKLKEFLSWEFVQSAFGSVTPSMLITTWSAPLLAYEPFSDEQMTVADFLESHHATEALLGTKVPNFGRKRLRLLKELLEKFGLELPKEGSVVDSSLSAEAQAVLAQLHAKK